MTWASSTLGLTIPNAGQSSHSERVTTARHHQACDFVQAAGDERCAAVAARKRKGILRSLIAVQRTLSY